MRFTIPASEVYKLVVLTLILVVLVLIALDAGALNL